VFGHLPKVNLKDSGLIRNKTICLGLMQDSYGANLNAALLFTNMKRYLSSVLILVICAFGIQGPANAISSASPGMANLVPTGQLGLNGVPTGVLISAKETTGQKNAKKRAKSYLKIFAFSRSGLIDQLKFEGFTTAQAKYAVDSLKINWKKQSEKKAKSYLKSQAFSKSGLYDQLIYEGFTPSQAKFGVGASKANWKKQAEKKAKSYLKAMAFSKSGLYDQLIYEGFTESQAEFGVSATKANWKKQAAKKAESYLDTLPLSEEELYDQLIFEGFTPAQAEYGVSESYY
jgi:hypothetical protein